MDLTLWRRRQTISNRSQQNIKCIWKVGSAWEKIREKIILFYNRKRSLKRVLKDTMVFE